MKDKIVKGRVKSDTPSKYFNPDKIVRTCPCCFRPIAVVGSVMAKHGFTRPGYGFIVGGCPGDKFKPYEQSDEGTVHIRDLYKDALKKASAHLANQAKWRELKTQDPKVPSWQRDVKISIDKTHPLWSKVFALTVANLESEIRGLKHSIKYYQQKIDSWVKA